MPNTTITNAGIVNGLGSPAPVYEGKQINTYRANTTRPNQFTLTAPQAPANVASFEQIVGHIAVGQMVRFSQNIQFYETATGQMVAIEQNVQTTGVGQIITFEQFII